MSLALLKNRFVFAPALRAVMPLRVTDFPYGWGTVNEKNEHRSEKSRDFCSFSHGHLLRYAVSTRVADDDASRDWCRGGGLRSGPADGELWCRTCLMRWRAAPFPATSSTMRFLLLAFGLLLVAPYVTRAADEPPAMVDPCTLLHEKDAMDVLQKPVKSTPTKTGALPTCLYKATPWGRVALTVYGTTETFEKRVDFAKFMWKEEPQDI